ncbi:hypothetical protein TNCV_3959281 [Trichonephila clavipes]|nr:hypothetical protein TNCV_3959281 [Trichonephila clavipes]
MQVDDAWSSKILWSDEVQFYINGAVNTRICRIWGTSTSNILSQQPLHSDYVTVFDIDLLLSACSDLFSSKLSFHKVLKDALSLVHRTVNFFNNRSFLLYRSDNIYNPLFYARGSNSSHWSSSQSTA